MVRLCSFRTRPASRCFPVAVLTGSLALGGCASVAPPAPPSPPAELPAETDAARMMAQLRLRLLEQEVQNAEVRKKLDDAIQEVIRANAQTPERGEPRAGGLDASRSGGRAEHNGSRGAPSGGRAGRRVAADERRRIRQRELRRFSLSDQPGEKSDFGGERAGERRESPGAGW